MRSRVGWGCFSGSWLGLIGVAVSDHGVLRIELDLADPEGFVQEMAQQEDLSLVEDRSLTAPVVDQIRAYLAGDLREFDVVLDWRGVTEFQRRVLEATRRIPYGETRSYGQVAEGIGSPRAARAVGQAERANPAPVVVPCHRVIGADGSLRGYGGPGGVDRKKRLLEWERRGVTRA